MKSLYKVVKEDFLVNSGNPKGLFVCFMFRISHAWRGSSEKPRLSAVPLLVLYRLLIEWILSVEIPPKTIIGPGLAIFHGQGIVINGDTKLGRGVTLRNGVTIGHKYPGGGCPIIGDNVSIGANSVIIGELRIGSNCIIGALSLVNKSFGCNLVIAGNPADVISS
jgi:putative colanic acid biosynthesis acetyltransferase WcaB